MASRAAGSIEPLLGQHRLERANAQRDVGQLRTVLVMMVIVVVVIMRVSHAALCYRPRARSSFPVIARSAATRRPRGLA